MQLLGQGGRVKGENDREDDAMGMARGVLEMVEEVVEKEKGREEVERVKYVKKMRDEKYKAF